VSVKPWSICRNSKDTSDRVFCGWLFSVMDSTRPVGLRIGFDSL